MNKPSLIKTVSTCAVSIALLILTNGCTDENGIDSAFLKQRKEAAPSVADSRDGRTYRTAKVGNVNWMAENAAYDTKDAGSGCYGGIGANCETYGRLYTWQSAAMEACPAGWRLPNDVEWADLRAAVGGDARLLRAKSWSGGSDRYGWTALPGGFRAAGGAYSSAGENGGWWSATEDARAAVVDSARYWGIAGGGDGFDGGGGHKAAMASVRCVEAAGGSARRYYVSFDADGGTPGVIYALGVDGGGSLGGRFPKDPDKSGFAFDGWKDEKGRTYTAGSAINENTALKAVWRSVPEYTVSFNVDGGTPTTIADVKVDSGKTMGTNFPTPSRAEHSFEGWYDGAGTQYAAQTVIHNGAELTAKWARITYYTIKFDAGGATGTAPDSVRAADGAKITLPGAGGLTNSGKLFGGWSADGATYNSGASYTVTANVTMTALWNVDNRPGSILISTSTDIYKLVITNTSTYNKFADYGTGKIVWLASGKTWTVSNVPAGQYKVEATVVTRAGYPDTYGVTTNLVTVVNGQTVTTRFP